LVNTRWDYKKYQRGSFSNQWTEDSTTSSPNKSGQRR